MLAAGQTGTHEADGGVTARTNGATMLIDPWGSVIAAASDTDELTIVVGDLDRQHVETVRTKVPSLRNRRPEVYATA